MKSDSFRQVTNNAGGWSKLRLQQIPDLKTTIVSALREGMFPSEICEHLSMSIRTYREWRAGDKAFDAECVDALEYAVDNIEKEGIRRAQIGVLEPVISGGKIVLDVPDDEGITRPLMIRKYSDNLMMFILRGRRRDVYGDQTKIETTHRFDVEGARRELAEKLAKLAEHDSQRAAAFLPQPNGTPESSA